jgi:hypothetical protein
MLIKLFQNKYLIAFSVLVFYGFLILHDLNLYSHFDLRDASLLAFLRLLLIVTPLAAAFFSPKRKWLVFVWLVFVPYLLYSFAEIRHVAELCPLSEGQLYTGQCVEQAWYLFPTFVYAFMGFLIFIATLMFVSATLFRNSQMKRLFIIAITFYSSFASIFGLYARVNVWDILVSPPETFRFIIATTMQTAFWQNTVLLTVFTLFITFIFHRLALQYPKILK